MVTQNSNIAMIIVSITEIIPIIHSLCQNNDIFGNTHYSETQRTDSQKKDSDTVLYRISEPLF